MSVQQKLVISFFRALTGFLCRIDDEQLNRIPLQGPFIIVTNHTNVLEIPIIYTHLQPRPVTGFVASVRWEKSWSRWLLDVCQAIPVRRGEADIGAIRRGVDMLKAGYFVIVMPEGTRSGDGCLQKAHPGIVLLAQYSQAALVPVAFYGGERYKENVGKLQRTYFHIAVGDPFRIDFKQGKVTRQVRQAMVDEVMYQIASLLPAQNRGVYGDFSLKTTQYLRY